MPDLKKIVELLTNQRISSAGTSDTTPDNSSLDQAESLSATSPLASKEDINYIEEHEKENKSEPIDIDFMTGEVEELYSALSKIPKSDNKIVTIYNSRDIASLFNDPNKTEEIKKKFPYPSPKVEEMSNNEYLQGQHNTNEKQRVKIERLFGIKKEEVNKEFHAIKHNQDFLNTQKIVFKKIKSIIQKLNDTRTYINEHSNEKNEGQFHDKNLEHYKYVEEEIKQFRNSEFSSFGKLSLLNEMCEYVLMLIDGNGGSHEHEVMKNFSGYLSIDSGLTPYKNMYRDVQEIHKIASDLAIKIKNETNIDTKIRERIEYIRDKCFTELLDAYAYWDHKPEKTIKEVNKTKNSINPDQPYQEVYEQLNNRLKNITSVKINENVRKRLSSVVSFLRLNLVSDQDIVSILSDTPDKIKAKLEEYANKKIDSLSSIEAEDENKETNIAGRPQEEQEALQGKRELTGRRKRLEQIAEACRNVFKEFELYLRYMEGSKGDSANTKQRKKIVQEGRKILYHNPAHHEILKKQEGRLISQGTSPKSKNNIDQLEELLSNFMQNSSQYIDALKEQIIDINRFVNKYSFYKPEFYNGTNLINHANINSGKSAHRNYNKTRDNTNDFLSHIRKKQSQKSSKLGIQNLSSELDRFIEYVNHHLLVNYFPFYEISCDIATGFYSLTVSTYESSDIVLTVNSFDNPLNGIRSKITYVVVGSLPDSVHKLSDTKIYHVAPDVFIGTKDNNEKYFYKIAFPIPFSHLT